jgi:hypothetical protein
MMRTQLLIAALLCSLISAALAQQDPDSGSQAEKAAAATETEAATEPAVEIDDNAESVTPSTYQASEQISDDLSVSFPVDI